MSTDARSRTGERDRRTDRGENDRVLPAPVRHPRAAPAERRRRIQHDAHDRGAGERRQKAQCEQCAAAGLAQAGDDRKEHTRAVAEQLEEHAGAAPAVPAEPAEQLLGAVADERDADDDPEDQQTGVHGCHASTACAGTTRAGAVDVWTMSAAPEPSTRCGSRSRRWLVTAMSPVGWAAR